MDVMKVFKDNAGISLIWVLILIVVVGGLSAVLLNASTHNIRFGIDEVDTSRAFYAADAGVEHTRAYLSENSINDLNLENPDEDGFGKVNTLINTLKYSDDFVFGYDVKYNSERNIFRSFGYLNDDDRKYTQIIEFKSSSFLTEIAVLINKLENNDDIDDYTWFRGDEKDFGRDNVALVEMGGWKRFLYKYYGMILDDINYAGVNFLHERNGDNNYFKIEWEDYEDDWELGDYKGWEEKAWEYWERKDMSTINNPLIDGKYWFLTPKYVEFGEDENFDEYDDDTEYKKGDYVFVEDDDGLRYYFEAIDNFTGIKPGEGEEWENFWKVYGGDDDSEFRSITIKDSILIIDGSVRMLGNISLKNSLILVKDDIEIGGMGNNPDLEANLEESLILAFNEDSDNDSLVTTGNPSINLKSLELDDLWPGTEDLIWKLGSSYIDTIVKEWRQVQ